MRQSVSAVRVLSFALLAVATAAGTTGCFKRGAKGDYALAPEAPFPSGLNDCVWAWRWLRSHAARGRLVLLGDPGRNYFSAQGLEERARYDIPTSLQLENRGMRETVVWRVLPHP